MIKFFSLCRELFPFLLCLLMVLPYVTGCTDRKPDNAMIDIERIGMALDRYAVDNGDYPTTEQGLDALMNKPTSQPEPLNWNGPYVKENTRFLDPWKNPYVYELPSTHKGYDYDLYSMGTDGVKGGDDITNWARE